MSSTQHSSLCSSGRKSVLFMVVVVVGGELEVEARIFRREVKSASIL
jgi:hypothetical protein